MRFFTDRNHIIHLQTNPLCAIAADQGPYFFRGDVDFNFTVTGHDQRAAGQGMGIQGNQHHGIQLGMHDGPAAGQGVGGRAGRCRDNQAVGALSINKVPVDHQFKIDHVHTVTRQQHDIVQGTALTHHGFAPAHFQIQQEALFRAVFTIQHLANPGFDFGRKNIGKETQVAAVHAQYRHVIAGQNARSAQQTAIAPDHNHQIAGLAHLRRTGGLQTHLRQIADNVFIEDDGAIAAMQKVDQLTQ